MGLHGDYSGGLLHWPPSENPYYQQERDDDALTEWELERQMEQVAHAAEGLAWRAWELEGDGYDDLAEPYADLSEKSWKRYAELRRELVELESGF